MKTRIKVLKMGDDTVKYQPEHRWFGFWFTWKNYGDSAVTFSEEQDARRFIVRQLADEKGQTVVSQTVINIT